MLGRSYGGGVLELEPNEAEQLPIPLRGVDSLDIKELHALLVKDDIDSVLDITDQALLIKGLGLSVKDARSLRAIWKKLRDRRINRKHSRRTLPKNQSYEAVLFPEDFAFGAGKDRERRDELPLAYLSQSVSSCSAGIQWFWGIMSSVVGRSPADACACESTSMIIV